jgi:DNA modification methylase
MSTASNRGCTPWLQDADVTLYHGDVLDVLCELPAESVDCCVTSPPYWGLRDYDDPAQVGLEPDPLAYVDALVAVFSEVRRVLTAGGTVWLNLGDSYSQGSKGNSGAIRSGDKQGTNRGSLATRRGSGLGPNRTGGARSVCKTKDLVGIPWRVAFALQQDGWYLRSDIIWAKPNPMPESVTDRPTKAHEYVFLLSKQPRYFFDQEAVRERYADPDNVDLNQPRGSGGVLGELNGGRRSGPDGRNKTTVLGQDGSIQHRDGERWPNGGRNIRSVWEIATQPYSEAHFATFPEELARRCIAAGCPENGTVLDPFIGSGTVAYVARKLGRHAVGIDLNESYLELAARRLQQQSLFAEVADGL